MAMELLIKMMSLTIIYILMFSSLSFKAHASTKVDVQELGKPSLKSNALMFTLILDLNMNVIGEYNETIN